MTTKIRRIHYFAAFLLLSVAVSVVADWDSYRSMGERYGYGTYTNWRNISGRTQTIVAWVNGGGNVVDYGVFNSSTGVYIGGSSLAPVSFSSWHQSIFGFGGGNCSNINVCPPTRTE